MVKDLENSFIRAASIEDVEIVCGITERAYAQYVDLLGAQPIPMNEDYEPRIKRGEVWLLVENATPIGLLVLEIHSDHAVIFSVAVEPTMHGHGIGRRLMAFSEAQVKTAGVSEIRLYTNALMERNIALYMHLGYSETGRRPVLNRPGSILVDMAKRV